MPNIFLYLRNRHFFGLDICVLILAAYFSCALRLDRLDLGPYWPAFFGEAGLALLVYPLVYRAFGLYSRYWRYASVGDLLLVIRATLTAGLLHSGLLLIVLPLLLPGFIIPRSIPFILLLLMLIGGAAPRLLVRTWLWHRQRQAQSAPLIPVLVYGAGEAGLQIVRELTHNAQLGLEVVGFVDDDPDKQHLYISDLPVLGGRAELLELIRSYRVGQVIIAMPSAPGKVVRELVDICKEAQVQVRTMPALFELLNGPIQVQQLREVRIEDLLRREPARIDDRAVRAMVQGKRVLVTGAGGSIGSELCRQILRYAPSQLVLLGHGENSIFAIHNELLAAKTQQSTGPHSNGTKTDIAQTVLIPVIADIRFSGRIQAVLAETCPQIVFHAAAHKHVPLMECNPLEAFTNNVLGTRNVLQAAQAVGVERFVMISSDKAVNPTSVMGASKRAAELHVLQAAERTGLLYVAVRFGNVLGSRGSVVLTFQQQIAAGGPVTITHPEMTRYFMTIPRSSTIGSAGRSIGEGGRDILAGYGGTGQDYGPGPGPDPAVGPGTGPGHRDCDYGYAPWREALRRTLSGP